MQDNVKALMWLNIAATDRIYKKLATPFLDTVAKLMPPAQIKKAQKAANRCIKQKFKNCD
jgi:hypothetical protein